MVVRKNREEWKIYGNVFDQHTNEILQRLQVQGLFDELVTALALGKEANVFLATPGRKSDSIRPVIVKIYRLENANFKKMLDYLREDPRYLNMKPGRRQTIFSWCQREYRNLMLARESIEVPVPMAFKSNVLVMSMIGEPAKQLKDQTPENPEAFLELILENIRKLWKGDLVHGDLSAFNILNFDERPVFIDFSQATQTASPNARLLLERDLKNIAQYFAKVGVILDVEKAVAKILKN